MEQPHLWLLSIVQNCYVVKTVKKQKNISTDNRIKTTFKIFIDVIPYLNVKLEPLRTFNLKRWDQIT